jgi:DNA-binding CsgD family transcriptional regulator
MSNMAERTLKLSKREQEIVDLASTGLLDKEIAPRLGITDNTIKTYWKRIRQKLGEGTRPGLVAAYVRQSGAEPLVADIHFEADWSYDYRTQIWRHLSDRPIPGGIQVDEAILLNEVLAYFHPEDAQNLRQLIDDLKTNDIDDFFFRARLVTLMGLVQTSTFVHVIRDDSGKPVTLLGHRTQFHDLAPLPVRELMVGYWEQDLVSGEFTADVNLLFIFSKTGQGPPVRETKYARIPPEELQEVRKAVRLATSKKRSHLRSSHRIEPGAQPFQWATIDVCVDYDSLNRGIRAHGSVLAFS